MLCQILLIAGGAALASAQTYKASFTEYGIPIICDTNDQSLTTESRYGAGDSFGSGNCNTATAACGFYNNPGYNAAASQVRDGSPTSRFPRPPASRRPCGSCR